MRGRHLQVGSPDKMTDMKMQSIHQTSLSHINPSARTFNEMSKRLAAIFKMGTSAGCQLSVSAA